MLIFWKKNCIVLIGIKTMQIGYFFLVGLPLPIFFLSFFTNIWKKNDKNKQIGSTVGDPVQFLPFGNGCKINRNARIQSF